MSRKYRNSISIIGLAAIFSFADGYLFRPLPFPGGDRTYTLIYTGYDAAGNAAECAAEIVVPHDQRS